MTGDIERDIKNVEDRVEGLAQRVQAIEIKQAASDATEISIDRRLSNIEDQLKWVVRLIIGALIMAVIGFALGGGLVI